MVRDQLEKRGVHHPWLLQAVLDVPRHFFVPEESQPKAYEDGALPIGLGQTISQPYVAVSMIELLEPDSGKRILEVGVGSGYSAALLSRLAGEVYGVEREAGLLALAEKKLQTLGFSNVQLSRGDGSLGWAEKAPFDAILVSAASPKIPQALLTQLKTGGILVIPVGNREEQKLIRVLKKSEGHFQEKELYPVRFVPLIGLEGWPD